MPLLHIPASGKATPAYDLGECAKKAYLFDTTAEFLAKYRFVVK
jgi:hypothetical protein